MLPASQFQSRLLSGIVCSYCITSNSAVMLKICPIFDDVQAMQAYSFPQVTHFLDLQCLLTQYFSNLEAVGGLGKSCICC